jgi:Domain of unknown function (DUF4333)
MTSRRGVLRVMVAGMAATGALALAGCGDDESTATTTPTRTVDTAQVESEIEQQLSTPSAEVSSVTCPDDVRAETGKTFTCSASWDNGATGKVKVTQESPNRFTYEAVSGSVQVPGSTAETSIERELDRQGAPEAQANCPDTIVVKVDSTVTCDLSGGGGQATGTVSFTFSDASGTVDPSSVQTG